MEKETQRSRDEEFGKFKELTRRLLMVSKKELDKQKAADKGKEDRSTQPEK